VIAGEFQMNADVFLFRLRYNLPPNDPRLLALTEEEIALDLELALAVREDASLQQCIDCGSWTYRTHCPVCPGAPALNELERLVEREQRGEEIDWQAAHDSIWGDRPPGVSPEEWERRKQQTSA
jgi:hypothetical protein